MESAGFSLREPGRTSSAEVSPWVGEANVNELPALVVPVLGLAGLSIHPRYLRDRERLRLFEMAHRERIAAIEKSLPPFSEERCVRRRPQGSARRGDGRRDGPHAPGARSATGLEAEPSAHLHHLRGRRCRRPGRHRDLAPAPPLTSPGSGRRHQFACLRPVSASAIRPGEKGWRRACAGESLANDPTWTDNAPHRRTSGWRPARSGAAAPVL